jgi:hypothetical protein
VSRKGITLVLAGYFVAALAIAVFEHWLEPFPQWNVATVSYATGNAISIYVLSAILPLIVWAFSRFRAQNASVPLIVWGLLGLVVGGLQHVSHQFDREQEMSKLVSAPTLAGKDRDDFFHGTKLSCVDDQQKNELNRRVGVTDQQIDTYCECIADSVTTQVLTNEIKFIVQTGKQPDSLKEKIVQSSVMCSRSVLRNQTRP